MRYLVFITLSVSLISGCSVFQMDEDIDPNVLPPSAAGSNSSERGTIVQEFWDNIEGTTVRDLSKSDKFTSQADAVSTLGSFKGAINRSENYGSRIRGYLYPDQTGPYTFYITSNDSSELWISPGENPDSSRLIAYMDGYAAVGDISKYPFQKSEPINLEAGKVYYISALQKQGLGSDQLAVYWEGPGVPLEIIPGKNLSPIHLISDDNAAGYSTGYRLGYYDGSYRQPYNDAFPPLDSDGDGLPDSYELAVGLDPLNNTDATADSDGDLLTNLDEYLLRTDINNKDTDGDGIDDGFEVAYGLNALDSQDAALDNDGDGVSNFDEYIAGTDIDDSNSVPTPPPPPVPEKITIAGWSTQFYSNGVLTEPVKLRNDKSINFDWAKGSPGTGVPSDNFSVRFTGFVVAQAQGVHTFEATANDYVKLWVGDQLVINHWKSGSTKVYSGSINLDEGKEYPIKLEYAEGVGSAVIKLHWKQPNQTSQLLDNTRVNTIDTVNEKVADSDNDEIPDFWELITGTDPFDPTDASGDIDGDGIDNLTAYLSSLKNAAQLKGFTAQYFSGIEMDALLLVKQEPAINFDWGKSSPYPSIPADNFSIRFLTTLKPAHNAGTETYTFYVTANDYARLYLNGNIVVEHWTTGSTNTYSGKFALDASQTYDLILEYAEGAGSAFIKLEWESASKARTVITDQYSAFTDMNSDSKSDTDNDGIPDYWEIQYGMNPLNSNDANLDNNGDGISNINEFNNNTDPGSTGIIAPPAVPGGGTITPPPTETPPTTPPTEGGSTGKIIYGGSVTVNWTAPDQRVDGTPLSIGEISEYILSYSKDGGAPIETIISDPYQTSYTYNGLALGKYEFYLQAVDSDGLKSPKSAAILATLK